MGQNDSPTVSVERALSLLGLFANADAGVRLCEARDLLGLPGSTAHRLLAQLVRAKFVQRDERRHVYYAGEALLTLAASLAPDITLRASALPELRELVHRTGETTSLVVMRDAQAYFVTSLHRPGSDAEKPQSGATLPLHASASGRALLSRSPREYIEHLIPHERLKTSVARTTRTAFLGDLDECRARGFAMSFEETAPGIVAVSSPIAGAGGRVYGALSIAAAAERVRRDDLFSIGRALSDSSARIGRYLP